MDELRELTEQAGRFEQRLNQVKSELAAQQIDWYPYRTLTVFAILDKLLAGARRNLLELAGGDSILDIGCADGANAFFLESLGHRVLAIDNCGTNHNQLRGFLALKTALGSSVDFQAVDLDSQFSLPDETFGFTLFLGVLYHLKNPYYVLEALANRTRYCLLSTRIAQWTPQGHPMQHEPLAYLLDPDECNNDSTNHWIFSEAGLRRLLKQTGWIVHDFRTTGATRSEPARLDRDERAYCLLESRVARRYSVKLLEGWHPLEQHSYRWTERRFAIELRPPSRRISSLRFDFRWMGSEAVTLSAKVNGIDVAPATFASEGSHSYRIPVAASTGSTMHVEFEADRCLPIGIDERELALLVAFWAEGQDTADPTLPFQFT